MDRKELAACTNPWARVFGSTPAKRSSYKPRRAIAGEAWQTGQILDNRPVDRIRNLFREKPKYKLKSLIEAMDKNNKPYDGKEKKIPFALGPNKTRVTTDR